MKICQKGFYEEESDSSNLLALHWADSIPLEKLGLLNITPAQSIGGVLEKICKLWRESRVAYNDKGSLKYLFIYLQW